MNVRRTIAPGDLYAQGLDLGPNVEATCVIVNGDLVDESSVSIPHGSGYENVRSIGVVIPETIVKRG